MNFNLQRAIERKKEGLYRPGRKHVEKCVAKVEKENKSLQELTVTYSWFPSLMEGILNNHIQVGASLVKSKMLNLSHLEAESVGKTLSKALKSK